MGTILVYFGICGNKTGYLISTKFPDEHCEQLMLRKAEQQILTDAGFMALLSGEIETPRNEQAYKKACDYLEGYVDLLTVASRLVFFNPSAYLACPWHEKLVGIYFTLPELQNHVTAVENAYLEHKQPDLRALCAYLSMLPPKNPLSGTEQLALLKAIFNHLTSHPEAIECFEYCFNTNAYKHPEALATLHNQIELKRLAYHAATHRGGHAFGSISFTLISPSAEVTQL